MLSFEALQGFVLYLQTGNYSSITAQNYQNSLTRFVRFLNNPDISSITQDDILRYFKHIKDDGKSGITVFTYWIHIRSFFRWAHAELGIERPDLLIPAPNYTTNPIIPFTDDEIKKMSTHTKRSKRNHALILLLLDTGLRVSEVSRLTVNDVNLETGQVNVHPFQTGKKSRPRVVYLGSASRRSLWQYLASRDDLGLKNAPLFATKTNSVMVRNAINQVLYRIGAGAGVPNVHPHKFRHTFAISYLRNGGDIFTLQRLLGHASLKMVQHYLYLSDYDSERSHRRASPVDNLRL